MIILHQIGKPLSKKKKKMYIVRKLDDDIKRQKFIHVPELTIIHSTILLLNRICENNPTTADIIAQCFIEESNITSFSQSELSLSILICLLNEPIDLTLKMNIVKFFAVLCDLCSIFERV